MTTSSDGGSTSPGITRRSGPSTSGTNDGEAALAAPRRTRPSVSGSLGSASNEHQAIERSGSVLDECDDPRPDAG